MNKVIRFILKNGQIINASVQAGECNEVFKQCKKKGAMVELSNHGYQTLLIYVDEIAAALIIDG